MKNNTLQMMILIAAPYLGGTNDKPCLVAKNVKEMTEMAPTVYKKGHLPVPSEWFALPLIEVTGSPTIADDVLNWFFHPITEKIYLGYDAVLRIGGFPLGADEMVENSKKGGKKILFSIL